MKWKCFVLLIIPMLLMPTSAVHIQSITTYNSDKIDFEYEVKTRPVFANPSGVYRMPEDQHLFMPDEGDTILWHINESIRGLTQSEFLDQYDIEIYVNNETTTIESTKRNYLFYTYIYLPVYTEESNFFDDPELMNHNDFGFVTFDEYELVEKDGIVTVDAYGYDMLNSTYQYQFEYWKNAGILKKLTCSFMNSTHEWVGLEIESLMEDQIENSTVSLISLSFYSILPFFALILVGKIYRAKNQGISRFDME